MPVEIRELVIKAKIGNEGSSTSGSDSDGSENSEKSINLIVEKVLAILKEKSER